jgi:hypothetical protein
LKTGFGPSSSSSFSSSSSVFQGIRGRGRRRGRFNIPDLFKQALRSLVTATALLAAAPALACAVCYGEPDAPMTYGLNWAILVLGGVVGVVLVGVAGFFVYVQRRTAQLARTGATGTGISMGSARGPRAESGGSPDSASTHHIRRSPANPSLDRLVEPGVVTGLDSAGRRIPHASGVCSPAPGFEFNR